MTSQSQSNHLTETSNLAKAILRTKDDEGLKTALDRIENEQEIAKKMSVVTMSDNVNASNDDSDMGIDILPLEQVGFSDTHNELIITLNKFTEILQAKFPHIELLTKTNIDIEAIEQELAPLKFSEDIKVFYYWSLQFGDALETFFCFPSIAPLASSYRFSLEIMQDCDEPWSKTLFSFSYKSQCHLITPLSENPLASSMIYYYEIVGGDFEGHFDSLLGMVNTYIEGYESGLFHIDGNYLEFDEEDWNNIRLNHNPNAYNPDTENEDTKEPKTTTNYIEYWEVDTWPEEWKKYQMGEVEDL